MNTIPVHNSVVIVGAGPSGLMMAAQLLKSGVHPLILDSKTALSSESRALAVQARSLEIFRQLGLDEQLLAEGNAAKGMILHHDTEELLQLNLSELGHDKSPFPYVLIVEQSKTERILLDYLTANACPLYWNTEVLDVHQTDRTVTLRVMRNGREQLLTCDWLIGADGASSRVRKGLSIPFSGGTYENRFFLADVTITGGVTLDAIQVFLQENGFTAVFPMKDAKYRFIGILPEVLSGKADISFEDLRPFLTYNLGFAITDECCSWLSTYQLHHRMADRFRAQRCFLIGDAAHIHSPAGGQGMNTGLQDAFNLAWKLAGVVSGKYQEAILDTYSKERIPVAKALLESTDRLFTFGNGQNWLARKLRSWILPKLLGRIWKLSRVNKRVFGLVSQTAIHYRDSALSVHHSLAKSIVAGDRLPYIRFFDEKLKTETDLHAWCQSGSFTLIVIGQLSQRDILALMKWIKLSYPQGVNFYYLPPSKRNQSLFDCFEVTEHARKALIVRPDMHIGYINDIVDVELLGAYLEDVVQWR